jgi:hypothetical protein
MENCREVKRFVGNCEDKKREDKLKSVLLKLINDYVSGFKYSRRICCPGTDMWYLGSTEEFR